MPTDGGGSADRPWGEPALFESDPALPPSAAERKVLTDRWATVAGKLRRAPSAWRRWGVSQLAADPVGAALARLGPAEEDPRGAADYDAVRDARAKVALGQVFTPEPLADLLAAVCGAGEEGGWTSSLVLDPACGAGSLLLAVARRRRAAGWETARVLDALEGWDSDPAAAWLGRCALVEWAIARPSGEVPTSLRVRGGVDALAEQGAHGSPLGAVICNPPYLEAKRMRGAGAGLRASLQARFPLLDGAFDLYLAFCWRALELAGDGARVALLLPNKVLQGRYAASFREALLGSGPRLTEVVDLSRMVPRPFAGSSVYPVMLGVGGPLRPGAGSAVRTLRVLEPADLARPVAAWGAVEVGDLSRVGGEHPIFVPFPETWPDLVPLLALPRLGEVATAVSTCSFHARGLREQFVGPDRPAEHAHPYLGARSRARRAEVSCFRVRWDGGWIRYDQEALRVEHRNPLPSLTRTFLRPKAIFCQHARRMTAVADFEGRWVTKDVYPVGWPTDPAWSLELLVAVLNSTVFSALYNTFYQGVLVGGETYHYLPAFLRWVPVPPADHPALAGVPALVRALHEGEGPPDPERWLALDRAVAEAYGVTDDARERMVRVHLARVGAPHPPRLTDPPP